MHAMRSENQLEKLEMAFANLICSLRMAFLSKNTKNQNAGWDHKPIRFLDGFEGQGESAPGALLAHLRLGDTGVLGGAHD